MSEMDLRPCPRCGIAPTEREIRATHLPPTVRGPGALITVQIAHHCLPEGLPHVVTTVRGRDYEQCAEGWNRGIEP